MSRHSIKKSPSSASSSAKDLLDGISDFSHIYLIGMFNQNKAELGKRLDCPIDFASDLLLALIRKE
jgi:hypothetical protein